MVTVYKIILQMKEINISQKVLWMFMLLVAGRQYLTNY